jgi:hypothetical protein
LFAGPARLLSIRVIFWHLHSGRGQVVARQHIVYESGATGFGRRGPRTAPTWVLHGRREISILVLDVMALGLAALKAEVDGGRDRLLAFGGGRRGRGRGRGRRKMMMVVSGSGSG